MANERCLRERLKRLAALDTCFAQGGGAEELRAAWEHAGGHPLLLELDEILAEIGEGAGRIRDIAGDMRSISRSDGGDSCVDVNEVIRSAVRVSSVGIRHHATVKLELAPDLLVRGNAGRLSQVFINLLVNAGQAMAEHRVPNGQVLLRSRHRAGSVVVEVTDNGPGIRPEHVRRIFETFFTTKGAKGTGLGLSLSRQIVRSYGGDIRVESTLGSGATFTVTLPSPPATPKSGSDSLTARGDETG